MERSNNASSLIAYFSDWAILSNKLEYLTKSISDNFQMTIHIITNVIAYKMNKIKFDWD